MTCELTIPNNRQAHQNMSNFLYLSKKQIMSTYVMEVCTNITKQHIENQMYLTHKIIIWKFTLFFEQTSYTDFIWYYSVNSINATDF